MRPTLADTDKRFNGARFARNCDVRLQHSLRRWRTPMFLSMRRMLFVLACASACAKFDREGKVPGTYKISSCKVGPCEPGDTTGTVTSGTLVLLDSSYSWKALPESAGALLGRLSYTVSPLNGCYVLGSNVGATHWQRDRHDPRVIEFGLSNSPDSWYLARVKVHGHGLEGTATSSGSGAAAPPPNRQRDSVAATRIGEPALALCIEASSRVWRQLHGGPPPNTR
jgi:hypothetical protein